MTNERSALKKPRWHRTAVPRESGMKISTKSRYALRLCLDLARNQGNGWVALKDISGRQDISKKYLEQIVHRLHGSGILEASRGFQGGYRLARAPSEITLGDVLNASETSDSLMDCIAEAGNCKRAQACMTRLVWEGLKHAIDSYVNSVTLQSILDEHGAKELVPCERSTENEKPVRTFQKSGVER